MNCSLCGAGVDGKYAWCTACDRYVVGELPVLVWVTAEDCVHASARTAREVRAEGWPSVWERAW